METERQTTVSTDLDFRDYLRNELISRCRKNQNYSLRAFARALGLESSFLSKILLGRRAITEKLVMRIAPKLHLSEGEQAMFRSRAAEGKNARRLASRARARAEFKELSLDTFEAISNWYHYAILELTAVQQFSAEPLWISRALGIDVETTRDAIDRLIRMGLISRQEDGSLRCNENCTTIGNRYSAMAFRKLQSDLLAKAGWAMDRVPMAMRDQSSITMAIDSRRFPKAKEKIKRFRRELMQFLQGSPTKDTVYQLVISCFPTSAAMIPETLEPEMLTPSVAVNHSQAQEN